MNRVKQNTARGFYVLMVDQNDLATGLAGLTLTVTLSKAGAAAADVTLAVTVTDLGSGVYWIAPDAAHRDTLGYAWWHIIGAGAAPVDRFEEIEAVDVQNPSSMGLGLIDTAISTRSTYDGSDTAGTATLLSRLSDARAGYLDNLNGLTVAAIADGVWDEPTAGHVTAGTYGASVLVIGTTYRWTNANTNYDDVTITEAP